jgi:5-hydroxyisourate hydrolase
LFDMPLGWVSAHVLDTTSGLPAAGMTIDIKVHRPDGWTLLATVQTNQDGKTDQPVLADAAMAQGVYELEFHAADYFRARGVALDEPPFLDRVPIRFGIADRNAHYHVPLLCTPWNYSTYRGS